MPMILPMTKQKLEILKLFQNTLGKERFIAFDEFVHWALYSVEHRILSQEERKSGSF